MSLHKGASFQLVMEMEGVISVEVGPQRRLCTVGQGLRRHSCLDWEDGELQESGLRGGDMKMK